MKILDKGSDESVKIESCYLDKPNFWIFDKVFNSSPEGRMVVKEKHLERHFFLVSPVKCTVESAYLYTPLTGQLNRFIHVFALNTSVLSRSGDCIRLGAVKNKRFVPISNLFHQLFLLTIKYIFAALLS